MQAAADESPLHIRPPLHSRYISQQINYSLVARETEQELVPPGLDQRAGILAWSPLQFGLLSGKFRRGQRNLPNPASTVWTRQARSTKSDCTARWTS